jgi:hypothetical protein
MLDDQDSVFDDADTDENIVFISAENADDMLQQFVKTYTFDAEPGRPREGFMVRMAQIGTLQRWIRINGSKSSDSEMFRALLALIADSVVDHKTLQPIWSEDGLKKLATANAPRFNRMTEAVLDRNDLKKMSKHIEAAEKN